MNPQFNLQDQVHAMYPTLRRAVLFTLIGSVNATLVNEATRIIIEFDDMDFKAVEPTDVINAMHSNDVGPVSPEQRISDIRLLTALSQVWANDLQTLSNDETQGTFANTLQFMTGKQRTRTITGIKTLKSLGIECSEEDNKRSQAMQLGRDQMRADALSLKRGQIEWLYDKVFSVRDTGCDGDYWTGLSPIRRETLTSKTLHALNNAYNQAIDNVKFGRTGQNQLGLSDVILIKDWIVTVAAAFAPPAEPVKPKVVRRVKKEEA